MVKRYQDVVYNSPEIARRHYSLSTAGGRTYPDSDNLHTLFHSDNGLDPFKHTHTDIHSDTRVYSATVAGTSSHDYPRNHRVIVGAALAGSSLYFNPSRAEHYAGEDEAHRKAFLDSIGHGEHGGRNQHLTKHLATDGQHVVYLSHDKKHTIGVHTHPFEGIVAVTVAPHKRKRK